MTAAYDPSTVLRPAPDLHVEHIDGETVVYDPLRRDLHLLDTRATAVWDLLDGTRTLDEVCTELAAVFGAPVEVLRADLPVVVADLRERGLLASAP